MARGRQVAMVVAVILAVAAGVGVMLLQRLAHSGLPLRSGQSTVAGLGAAVEVSFDDRGVPHLAAESGRDLAVALGYLHANDRLAQMELGRRLAAGRLSELLGERTVAIDVRSRQLRLRGTAEIWWQATSGESKDWLEAYALGVNAWLEERGRDLPPFLRALRVLPEPWHPVDSLSFGVMMAHDLTFWNGFPEEERFLWLRELGAEAALDLLGEEPASQVHLPEVLLAAFAEAQGSSPGSESESEAESEAEAESDPAANGAVPESPAENDEPPAGGSSPPSGTSPGFGPLGSNNWAAGSDWTATSAPLLANDPHLPLRLPSVWYQVSLRSPDLAVSGVSLPGLPGVVIGQSDSLAWGMTHTLLDEHDLFIEQIDQQGRARRGNDWLPLVVTTETIRVKGKRPLTVTLKSTDRGPLLDADLNRRLPPRSLAWTAYFPSDPLSAFLTLARAQTVEEVLGGIGGFVGPAQNLVVADRAGNLLQVVLGRAPDRMLGDGRLPAPGWDLRYGWRGLADSVDNPSLRGDATALMVTANNDIRHGDADSSLIADFDLPHRARRIEQLLRERRDWSSETMIAIHTDVVDLYALELLALCDGEYEGGAARAWEILASWDGAMLERGEAALFALFEQTLGFSIFADEAAGAGLVPFASKARILRALRGQTVVDWLDDEGTERTESHAEIVGRALASAWDVGQQRWGSEVSAWPYGEIHSLDLQHAAASAPLIGRWYEGEVLPLPGSATTVAAYGGPWERDRQRVTYGPSMRFVADLEDPDRSTLTLPGGQSEHPKDPHYRDQLDDFFAGRTRPMHFSPQAIADATVSRLVLSPP